MKTIKELKELGFIIGQYQGGAYYAVKYGKTLNEVEIYVTAKTIVTLRKRVEKELNK